jgi:hypothetical protein
VLLLSLTLLGLICSKHIRTSLRFMEKLINLLIFGGTFCPIRIGINYYTYLYPFLSSLFLNYFPKGQVIFKKNAVF